MDEIAKTGLTALLTGAISGVFTMVLLRNQIREELRKDYDKDLRAARIVEYTKLYALFPVIAPYSRDRDPSYEDIRKLAADMREWYFGGGGLYLSQRSRPIYFEMKKSLDKCVANAPAHGMDDAVEPGLLAQIVEAGSNVRNTLAADIGTRKEALLTEN